MNNHCDEQQSTSLAHAPGTRHQIDGTSSEQKYWSRVLDLVNGLCWHTASAPALPHRIWEIGRVFTIDFSSRQEPAKGTRTGANVAKINDKPDTPHQRTIFGTNAAVKKDWAWHSRARSSFRPETWKPFHGQGCIATNHLEEARL